MAKKIVFSVLITIMLAVACVFFPARSQDVSQAAQIENISGNKFILTERVGYDKKHYFLNDNGEETFVNATVSKDGEYYSVVSKRKGASSGYSELSLTNDMQPFVERGVLYAQASATVSTESGSIKLIISSGENSQEVQTTADGLIKTPLLKIDNFNENVRFTFETTDGEFEMKLPTIQLHTQIEEVVLDEEEIQTVSPGQMISVDAYNVITKISGSTGNFMSFSKLNHAIHFNITKGASLVKVIGTKLVINKNAKTGDEIIFNVYSNKNSFSADTITSSNTVKLIVNAEKVIITVDTHFADAATIVGEGEYALNRTITLKVVTKRGYEFLGWFVDGVEQTKNKTLRLEKVKTGMQIFAKFKKEISIQSITVKRVYDGTTTNIAKENVLVAFNGLEEGDALSLAGINYENCSFSDANVGANKKVTMSYGTRSLLDADGNVSDIYSLTGPVPEETLGEITKREVTITAGAAQKEYGNSDPILTIVSAQNVVGGERINGNLSREKANTPEGEKLGKYKITLGNLETQNPNYSFVFSQDEYLEIVKRTLYLQNVVVAEKEYDGTLSATITAELSNIYNNEDVHVRLTGEFLSPNASEDAEARILSSELYGNDKDNYTLAAYTDSIFGRITPKSLTVTAKDCTFTYGDQIELNYFTNGIIEGDTLSGALSISSKEVGTHPIMLGSLANSNYKIEFISANCIITPRDVFVTAIDKSKTYAGEEPQLTYSAKGLIGDDTLSGGLLREPGEDVGQYRILCDDLSNSNYNIIYTEGVFEILPREITVEITFKDKEYDGTLQTDFDVTYIDNVKNENFDIEIEMTLSSKNCGISTVMPLKYSINNIDVKNYTFVYQIIRSEIEITKRSATVFVDAQSKTYGGVDPTFIFTAHNLVDGDSLDLQLSRQPGEDVGNYSYFIDEENREKNPNYELSVAAVDFEILPKTIAVDVEQCEKEYGKVDPEIKYFVQENFEFGQTAEDIIDGKITREPGEKVDVYSFDLSTLSSSKNYIFVNSADTNFEIVPRPVVVTIQSTEKVYGTEDPIFKYDVSNCVAGEELIVQILREYGEDVGEYTLTCGTNFNECYTIECVEAKLKITPYSIKIKADDKVKIYGDADPYQSVTIISGFLKNNDRLDDLISGYLKRDDGENVGEYLIHLGSFSLGKNYSLDFVEGKLTVLKRRLVITPLQNFKIYGDADPELRFEVSGEGLAFDDKLYGELSRLPGEDVKFYEITQNTLTAGDNYEIEFVRKDFEIRQRLLQIIPTTLSKEYGDEDEEMQYQIIGKMVDGDVLFGTIYREKDKYELERTGKYKILSSLEHPNYKIVLDEFYFTILPREIVIKANDVLVHYGDQVPELTYDILSGTLLDGDSIRGRLTWDQNSSVGTYDIINELSIGSNYNIVFIKGSVQIVPRELTIKSSNYTKIYGQEDPRFAYEITDGELINNDRLYGTITREKGEDVGIYYLINGLFNVNYHITFSQNYIEILKKDVHMISQVYDKIYDGSTRAILKNPHVSGIIDDVYLQYDINNCAEFESAQVGKNIKVFLHDIVLAGDKAFNYNLIVPSILYANIALQEIVNSAVKVSSKDAVLNENYQLEFTTENVKNQTKIENHRLVLEYDIWLENGDAEVVSDSLYTITINLPKDVFKKNNIYVYQRGLNGEITRVMSSKDEDGNIVISAKSLGHFYITIEDDNWMNYATLTSIVVLSILILAASISLVRKIKNRKKVS